MGKTAAELRQEIAEQRDEIGRDLDALGDRVSPSRIVDRRTEAVRSRFRSAKETVMGSPDEPDSPSLTERAGSAKDRAAGLAHDAADEVAGVPDRVRSGTQGNPLAAGLIAFGAGLLAATLIPASRREEQLASRVQPQIERLGGQIGGAGRELVDDLRPELQSAVDAVTTEATDAGHRVVDEAKHAATATASAARR